MMKITHAKWSNFGLCGQTLGFGSSDSFLCINLVSQNNFMQWDINVLTLDELWPIDGRTTHIDSQQFSLCVCVCVCARPFCTCCSVTIVHKKAQTDSDFSFVGVVVVVIFVIAINNMTDFFVQYWQLYCTVLPSRRIALFLFPSHLCARSFSVRWRFVNLFKRLFTSIQYTLAHTMVVHFQSSFCWLYFMKYNYTFLLLIRQCWKGPDEAEIVAARAKTKIIFANQFERKWSIHSTHTHTERA